MTVYDFSVLNKQGESVPLEKYKGKALLIVNTATGCGFTPQYEGLQKLYEEFSPHGFEILDFPCNQFLNQAPGTDEEITAFCKGRFGITFPQFKKIDVNGKWADPLYSFLKEQKRGAFGGRIKWNFTKFLVNKKGEVIARFSPATTPWALKSEIEKIL